MLLLFFVIRPVGGGGVDWTVVLEKIRSSTGPCLRDDFQNETMEADTVALVVGEGLKAKGVVQMWVSDWSKGNATTGHDLFQFAGEHPLHVVRAGAPQAAPPLCRRSRVCTPVTRPPVMLPQFVPACLRAGC